MMKQNGQSNTRQDLQNRDTMQIMQDRDLPRTAESSCEEQGLSTHDQKLHKSEFQPRHSRRQVLQDSAKQVPSQGTHARAWA